MIHEVDELIYLADDIAEKVKAQIKEMRLNNNDDYRRDLDGVSSEEYLVLKMVGEILFDGEANTKGLVKCIDIDDEDYDPTVWCSACRAKTASKCKCGPLAEND